jgi:hypothetical protein
VFVGAVGEARNSMQGGTSISRQCFEDPFFILDASELRG